MGFNCFCCGAYWVIVDVKSIGVRKRQKGVQKV